MNSNGPGGTSGAHTTCCEERPFSCEFLARLQELCLHGSQCLLSAQASWLYLVRVTTYRKLENLCVCVCVCVCVVVMGMDGQLIVLFIATGSVS